MKEHSDKFLKQLAKKIRECGPLSSKDLDGIYKVKVTTKFPPRLMMRFDYVYDLIVRCEKAGNGEVRFLGISIDNNILQFDDLSNVKIKVDGLYCCLCDIGEECLDAV